jgi:ribosomal-protein-alanine N-acetyltransferase
MRRRSSPSRANEDTVKTASGPEPRPGAKRPPTEVPCKGFTLREWRKGDIESLVRHANNIKIWRNLHDAFPHPYTRADAEIWIQQTSTVPTGMIYAIVVDGDAVGGIGITPMKLEHRRTAAIGYWLSETHWGRGITTEALRAMTEIAFASFDLARLEAFVFEWNLASTRVLEKAGYTREARMKKRITKDGRTVDCFLYALIRE